MVDVTGHKRSANPAGKTRPVTDPYEVWEGHGWTWRVLKKYESPEKEATDPYARWFCAVYSPYTQGGYDLGDVYVKEIKEQAVRIK
jgi:hypothetical protein